jgi:glycosyltransferase involved in cell wall biosynthesis
MGDEMISVIIPVYNAEKFIGRAIQSVMAQTYANFELIIVDDGSTDNSIAEISKAKKRNYTILTQSNMGVGAARNFGMAKARGSLIFFLDADDYILPHALQTLRDDYEVSRAPIVVGSAFRQSPSGYIIKNTPPCRMGNIKSLLLDKGGISLCVRQYMLTNDCYLVSHCWGRLYEKKFLDDNHLFFINTKVGEDGVFNIGCLTIASGVSVIDEPIYCFQMHNKSSSITAINNNSHSLEPLRNALNVYFFNNDNIATGFLRTVDRFIDNLSRTVKEFAEKGVQMDNVYSYRMHSRKDVIIDMLNRSDYPIIICGTDVVGQRIFEVCKLHGIEIIGFIDYDKNKAEGKLCCDRPVYESSAIPVQWLPGTFIISVLSIKDVVETLDEQNVDNWIPGGLILEGVQTRQFNTDFIINEEFYQTESCIIAHQAFMKKDYTFLRSLDIMITERCSLKCRDCSNLMQYFQQPRDINIFEVISDLHSLLLNVDEIMEARILGGDAFMHPEWEKIVQYATSQAKIKRVVVYTNGTIMPKNIDALIHRKVVVVISNYGPLSKKIEQLIYNFKYRKIWHKVVNVDTWIDCANIRKNNRSAEENNKLFKNCVATNLVTMTDGKLFRCPFAASAYRLGLEEAGLDIVTVPGGTIREYIHSKKSMNACDYCDSRILGKNIQPAIQIKEARPLWKDEGLLTATEMPDPWKLFLILCEVEKTIDRKIGSHIGARIGAQMGVQTWELVWIDIWVNIAKLISTEREEEILNCKDYNKEWKEIEGIGWGEHWNQIRNQLHIYLCYLIREKYQLDYNHPAFELGKLGVVITRGEGAIKVYGKEAKYLGEINITKEDG